MRPAVSVVMPVYNNAVHLPAAIDSILCQTLSDLELIVVDDGSTDACAEIAAEFARRDSRVRVFGRARDPALVSGARAANAGIAETRGKYVARMDSDDIALPNRLELELAHLERYELDICGGQAEKFDGDSGSMWYPQTREGIRGVLCLRSGLLNPTLLVRGDLMRAARYGEAEAFEEYEFQTRMFFAARMGNVRECVHRFRVHPNNTTVVHTMLKGRSRWRLRFQYFFRLFPKATVADFRAVHAVAWKVPLETQQELATAGRWLVALSRVADPEVRDYMSGRWSATCALATVQDRALAEDVAARITAPPGHGIETESC
jgi:glycosyltransferase involved in cell wall biosynthesis